MKKNHIAILLACSMILSALSACGGDTTAAETDTDTVEETTEGIVAEEANADDTEGAEAETNANEKMLTASVYEGRIVGDLSPIEDEPEDPVELSDEEAAEKEAIAEAYAEANRSRAGSGNYSILTGKDVSETYTYYKLIDEEEKQYYDAWLALLEDPGTEGHVESCKILSPDYKDKVWTAYYAVIYDHPELFWSHNDVLTDVQYYTTGGKTTIYFEFVNTVNDYQVLSNELKEGALDILNQIDINGSEMDVARQIHDELMDVVSYDHVTYDGTNSIREELAHSAYGALVKNSQNVSHKAVCDGYALAYEYLLRQAGIECMTICGMAGSDPSDLGGHAWNLAKLDGIWYEVDVTWDDPGDWPDTIERTYKNTEFYEPFWDAWNDASYMDKISHQYFAITTSKISNYECGTDYRYPFGNGGWVCMTGDSMRYRDSRGDANRGYQAWNVERAPIADGTGVSLSDTGYSHITANYVLSQSSSKVLSDADLQGLSKIELKVARNEIYARHGRKFKDYELQLYFDSKSWYKGTIEPEDFDDDSLNQIEKKNIQKIMEYERK